MKLAMSYDYITILNIYATDDSAPKVTKKNGIIKREIDKSTITDRYFNTSLSVNGALRR